MIKKMHKLESFTGDPVKYKMGNSILILSTYMGKSIRMKRVKLLLKAIAFSINVSSFKQLYLCY